MRSSHPPSGASKARLRLWLRLLRSTRLVETRVRERLRAQYGATLPQFDVLAALSRADSGMTMTELSSHLRVSNGNVTGIVDRLVREGHTERARHPRDRRTIIVSLTPSGRAAFERMAAAHETWVDEIFDNFDEAQANSMATMLARVYGPATDSPFTPELEEEP